MVTEPYDPKVLFDLSASLAGPLLASCRAAWEALARLEELFAAWAPGGDFEEIAEGVWVGRGTRVAATAELQGPALIGHDCELRAGLLVRGRVVAGDGVILGHATEVKNAILFDRVQAPHFSYIGDSVLGAAVHLGAGVILSNVKITGGPVAVRGEDGRRVDSGRGKLGALIGDGAEIGAGSVLCPGTVIGRGSIVYPLTLVRGTVPAGHILKRDGSLTPRAGL